MRNIYFSPEGRSISGPALASPERDFKECSMSSHVMPAIDTGSVLDFPTLTNARVSVVEVAEPMVEAARVGCLKGLCVALALQAGAVLAVYSLYQVFQLVRR
jgi:hypothetical protein